MASAGAGSGHKGNLLWPIRSEYKLTPTGHDDDSIKVAPKKEGKDKNGTIKLKKPPPKHKLPGNWRDGSVIDGRKSRAG